jgi:hypothetical protein
MQLPADEVKALLDYQLQAAEPIRPAWFRTSHHVPASKRASAGTAGGACKALKPQAQARVGLLPLLLRCPCIDCPPPPTPMDAASHAG